MEPCGVWPQLDGREDPFLKSTLERLGGSGEVVLDFSGMPRISTPALQAIEQLSSEASGKPVQIVLRGVNEQLYRVLKLLNLTEPFSFQN